MNATTHVNWSARPLRRARLIRNLLVASAVLAVGYSCWPWVAGQFRAQGLLVFILLLVFVRAYVSKSQADSARHRDPHCLSRIAAGHWRMTMADRTFDGSLQHAWHGWGWITLKICPFDRSRSQSIIVWRTHLSDADWHQLRVWTAWEVAMLTEPHP